MHVSRKKHKSLTSMILRIVCFTFIPLNIITIIVCSIVLVKSTKQIGESYQRELEVISSTLLTNLFDLEDKSDSFVLSHSAALTLVDTEDNIDTYLMIQSLNDIFEITACDGIFYLYAYGKEQLFLNYSEGIYTVPEIEDMKSELIEKSNFKQTESKWKIEELGGKYFLARFNEYNNYQVAFLVDIESNILKICGSGRLIEDFFYLTDGEKLLKISEKQIEKVSLKDWGKIFKNSFFIKNVQYTSDFTNHKMGLEISDRNYLRMIPIAYWGMFGIAIGCILLVFILWKKLRKEVIRPLLGLQNAMSQLEQDHLDYRIEQAEVNISEDFKYIYETFNRMAAEMENSRRKDAMMYQAEITNLKLQVNPHMLLNSLNMIYSLAQTKNYNCIQEFTLHLVDYFRYVLRENSTFVTLYKEMEFVKNYIEIQKIRFPETFTSVYVMPEEAEQALVPPLLVQNFVENAMKYALIPGSLIEFFINIRKKEDRLYISICDTGRGIAPDILAHLQKGEIYEDKAGKKHIGVWNCRRRMEIFYGKDTSINVLSTVGAGTQVWIEVPYIIHEGQAEIS